MNADILGRYVDLSDSCPSHDTLERVMGLVNPNCLSELKLQMEQSVSDIPEFQNLIAIDGKTIRGNRSKEQLPTHIVTAYCGEHSLSLGQVAVDEKSNEITAIPRLLRTIDIRQSIVTIDTMGTQTSIVDELIKGKGDYCLAVKGNQGSLQEDISLYFSDVKILSNLEQKGHHYQMVEKARGQVETRDYWISTNINWLKKSHPHWHKLRGIGMTRNTIGRDGVISQETRYFIFSFKGDVQTFASCVRGYWSVESMHWLLDVVYREDHTHKITSHILFDSLF